MTKEDLEFLAQFENNFKCALTANYTRNIPEIHLRRMKEIYDTEKNVNYHLCTHCTSSILRFIKDVGRLYNKIKEEENGRELLLQGKAVPEEEIHINTRKQARVSKTSDCKPKAKRATKNKHNDV